MALRRAAFIRPRMPDRTEIRMVVETYTGGPRLRLHGLAYYGLGIYVDPGEQYAAMLRTEARVRREAKRGQ